jgi:hypothetical protein
MEGPKKTSVPKKQKVVKIAPTVPEIVVPEVVEIPEVVETVEVACIGESLGDKIKNALDSVSVFIKSLKVVEAELKVIKSLYIKEHRKNTKRPKRNVSLMSHGFVKDVKISKELAEFLKVPFDTTISRPKVTTAISQYVKENDLANPEKKSIFKTDSVLEKILGEPRFLINKKRPELGMGFSYFNLQTYMKEHFLKD